MFATEKYVGAKYEETKELDVVDIAKLIRKDLKNEFRNIKFSVRTDKYIGGRSIDVVIKKCPFNAINPNYEQNVAGSQLYNLEGLGLIQDVQNILARYNYDKSQTQFDHYDVNFYSDVTFDFQLEKKWRAEAW